MANVNRLKVVPAEKRKSGIWLTDQLGKSTHIVSMWCSNTAQTDLQTFYKIAKPLNANVKDFLTRQKDNLGML